MAVGMAAEIMSVGQQTLQVAVQKMLALVEKIASQGGATREQVRKATARAKPGRPKAFTFNYRPPHKTFSLKLSFRKNNVERDEVIQALEAIIRDLRNQG